jgi:hypothetical protein
MLDMLKCRGQTEGSPWSSRWGGGVRHEANNLSSKEENVKKPKDGFWTEEWAFVVEEIEVLSGLCSEGISNKQSLPSTLTGVITILRT